MPRRRPGALRAEHRDPRVWRHKPIPRIRGLSKQTIVEIDRAEGLGLDDHLWPGATALALRFYQSFLSTPGRRVLYPQRAECSCSYCSFEDVRHSRDVLDDALARLPSRARADLGRQVNALDATYLRLTLPNPFPVRDAGETGRWWYGRLAA